jgi:hypothetical protein
MWPRSQNSAATCLLDTHETHSLITVSQGERDDLQAPKECTPAPLHVLSGGCLKAMQNGKSQEFLLYHPRESLDTKLIILTTR